MSGYERSSSEDNSLLLYSPQHGGLSQRAKVFIGAAVVAVVVVVVLVAVIFSARPENGRGHINIIMMISDGMGPASVTLARAAKGSTLTLDDYLLGTIRTRSSDSVVTDSAAGATAYSCGIHTYNGAIAVDDNEKPCGTLLEAAHDLGLKTGLVVTTRLTDATPGSFGSHANSRSLEDFIALQLLDKIGKVKEIDVMLGGGASHFDDRPDGINLLDLAKEKDYDVQTLWADIVNSTSAKLLGLFASGNLPFEIDRINTPDTPIPSLTQMALKAIETLNKDNTKGFFLMIEGSQIDLAGHSNDAAAQIQEVLAYDEVWQAVINFAKEDGHTIVLSTSDHETGGLTLAYQANLFVNGEYIYYPELLTPQTASVSTMAGYIIGGQDIQSVLQQYTTVTNLTASELAFIEQYVNSPTQLSNALGLVIGHRALVGFSTNGHSGIDVSLYGYIPPGLGVPTFAGSKENIDVGLFLEQLLKTNLTAITIELEGFATNGTLPADFNKFV